MMKISYAITVCNEHIELSRLITLLSKHIRSEDEIVVQCDQGNTTPEVYDVLEKFDGKTQYDDFHHYSHPLDNNFAAYKNNLNSHCNGDWIFQIDADEYPDEYLLQMLPSILDENSATVEAFWVPRINEVIGLTPTHVEQWGWRVDEKGWVNFPDYQMRIYRNKEHIHWIKPVHEQLVGYKGFSKLPVNSEYCLWHPKDISRQEKQNEFYETITRTR